LILYLAFPTLSAAERDIGVFTSLTLLPSNSLPALSVAWTLVREVVFYVVFATYFVSRRLLVAALVAWASVILFWWWRGSEAGIALTFLVSPRNLSFIVGVLVFHARRLADFTFVDVPAALIGLALVVWQSLVVANHVVATIGFALLVFAAASRFAQARVPPRGLMTLGAASYAIYLVHNPLLSVLVRVAKRVTSEPWIAFSVTSVLAIIAGVLYWRVIETPLLRWARARFVVE
jgi:peptidoglycan/LPS O-acetylase OafA/YrhL